MKPLSEGSKSVETRLTFGLLILVTIDIFFWGCAAKTEEVSTGSYVANLSFPADILEDTGKLDCDLSGITMIEFNFVVDGYHQEHCQFSCGNHIAEMGGMPVGHGIEVKVYAQDDYDRVLYAGTDTVHIRKDEVTVGDKIKMLPVTESNPGTDTVTDPESFTDNFNMTFMRIPAAGRTFKMGSPTDETGRSYSEIQHDVTLTQDYYMQETEVTKAHWRAIVVAAKNASLLPNGFSEAPSYFAHCGSDCPLENVTWNQIDQFIAALNQLGDVTYRLPTEAEWEYAARGGTTSALPTGELIYTDCELDPILNDIAWYCGNAEIVYDGCYDGGHADFSCVGPHPVKGRAANDYGLYDMHGNVFEWCNDWHEDYSSANVTDPQGHPSGIFRIYRGGSWYKIASYCRSANRHWDLPGFRDFDVGFRLVAFPARGNGS